MSRSVRSRAPPRAAPLIDADREHDQDEERGEHHEVVGSECAQAALRIALRRER